MPIASPANQISLSPLLFISLISFVHHSVATIYFAATFSLSSSIRGAISQCRFRLRSTTQFHYRAASRTYNKRHQYAAMRLDSQQVARHCGGRYALDWIKVSFSSHGKNFRENQVPLTQALSSHLHRNNPAK